MRWDDGWDAEPRRASGKPFRKPWKLLLAPVNRLRKPWKLVTLPVNHLEPKYIWSPTVWTIVPWPTFLLLQFGPRPQRLETRARTPPPKTQVRPRQDPAACLEAPLLRCGPAPAPALHCVSCPRPCLLPLPTAPTQQSMRPAPRTEAGRRANNAQGHNAQGGACGGRAGAGARGHGSTRARWARGHRARPGYFVPAGPATAGHHMQRATTIHGLACCASRSPGHAVAIGPRRPASTVREVVLLLWLWRAQGHVGETPVVPACADADARMRCDAMRGLRLPGYDWGGGDNSRGHFFPIRTLRGVAAGSCAGPTTAGGKPAERRSS
jgi:hypothetical protein